MNARTGKIAVSVSLLLRGKERNTQSKVNNHDTICSILCRQSTWKPCERSSFASFPGGVQVNNKKKQIAYTLERIPKTEVV